MGPKPTNVDLKTLKSALADLKALEADMGKGNSGAYGKLANATEVTNDIGPLIDGAGPQIATYINTRANAIREAIHLSGRGVSAAITMLQNTIDTYDKHETKTQQNANQTGDGGGGSGSGSGGGSSSGSGGSGTGGASATPRKE